MTDSRAAVGVDRLPWLDDEPKARAAGVNPRELLGWAVAGALAIAGTAYWLGVRSVGAPEPAPQAVTVAPRSEPSATIKLPEPQSEEVAPKATLAPAPDIVVPETKVETAVRRERAVPARRKASSAEEKRRAPKSAPAPARAAARPAVAPGSQYPALWPARQSSGAYGRIVRIGAFGSRIQAKQGWTYMVRAYPAVRRLPAVVVETRNSRGRRFYRFQIGTTSQAHSEVLCQRMRKIRLSCAVVGLPWKPKGVER